MLHRLDALRGQDPELGATAVEYALMVTMIAVVIIVAVTALGLNLIPYFTDAANGI
jgi:pilus assembly protein Flp/PilA